MGRAAAVFVVLVALARVAAAEPDLAVNEHGLLSVGTWLDGSSTIAGVVEGGVRIPGVPVLVHANAGYGHVWGTRGKLWRVGAGAESRLCEHTGSCVVFGVEVGRIATHWPDPDWGDEYRETMVLAGGRVGFDIGGERLRMRVIVELDRFTATSSDPEEQPEGGVRTTIALSAGYRF